jgi:hypothetical protein
VCVKSNGNRFSDFRGARPISGPTWPRPALVLVLGLGLGLGLGLAGSGPLVPLAHFRLIRSCN